MTPFRCKYFYEDCYSVSPRFVFVPPEKGCIRYPQMGTKPWTYETAIREPVQVGSLTKLIMQRQKELFAHGMTDQEITEKRSKENI